MNSSPKAQSVRRQKVAQIVSNFCHRWYDADGKWVDKIEKEQDARGTLWLCFGLFNGETRDVALANAILSNVPFKHHVPTRSADEVHTHFDIFVTNHATQLLVLHAAKMTGPVREKMESWARAGLADFPGNRQSDYQFHGHNDNMPSKAAMGMILGGEYFGDAKAVEHGLWSLRQLRSLLARRGLVSEYTSCTYLPLTLLNLSEIAEHARHKEARAIAAQCAERVWADILGHFHPPTGSMGGPHARSYQIDATAHLSNMNSLLWFTFGEEIVPDPSVEMVVEKVRLVHHHDEHASALGLFAWMSSADMHPPQYLVDWVNQRKYPFTLRASAERGEGGGNYHPGEVNTSHYQEADFALGTVFNEGWSAGQTDTYFLQYLRQEPARVENVRTGYVRYLVNDSKPSDGGHAFNGQGIINVLQDRRVALALSRPSLTHEGKEISVLKLTFVFPTHFGPLEKIEITDGHVFIQDGPLYLALRPLNFTNWGCRESIRIQPVDRYQQISFYNYEGPPRKFTTDELGRTLNGFIAVIGLVKEESFTDFRQRVLQGLLVDYFHFDSRVVRYQLGETLLEAACGVKSNRFRFATVNGKLLPRPAWEADGLPAERLPFLGEPPPPMPMEIPFSHLNVIWGPDAPWMIAAKGVEPLPRKIVQGKGWAENS